MKLLVLFLFLIILLGNVSVWSNDPISEIGWIARGDLARTGYYPGQIGKTKEDNKKRTIAYIGVGENEILAMDVAAPGILWRKDSYSNNGAGSTASSPIVLNGILYVAIGRKYLYAFDCLTGEELWEYKLDMFYKTDIISYKNNIYISSGNKILGLSAITGENTFTYSGDENTGFSSPTIFDGIMYFGGSDGDFYAIEISSKKIKWQRKIGIASYHSPIIACNYVCFGTMEGIFYALNKDTGEQKWKFNPGRKTHNYWWGAPSYNNGKIFVRTRDGFVYALNIKTGRKVWEISKLGDMYNSYLPVADNLVLAVSTNGYLYAISEDTGKEKWRFDSGFPMTSSPAIAKGKVYIGPQNGIIYSLDLHTGKQIWKHPTQFGDGIVKSIAISD
ncbi:PQQ-binding-like beta-propeller repeat protein [Planctomycetota bacterium]